MRVLWAIVALLLPLAAAAEPVTIRSGEHATFSRLVLSIPDGAEWRLGRDGSAYVLDLGRAELEFDIDGIFDRLPENRIADLSGGAGQLRLEPGCDCHSRAFLWQSDRLVLDLIDGPPPEASEFEAPLMASVSEPVTAPEPPAAPQPSPASVPVPHTLDVAGAAEPPALPPVFAPAAREPALGGLPDPVAPVSPPDSAGPDLTEFERAVAESLGRAASQGLLSPALDGPDPIVPAATEEEARPPPPIAGPSAEIAVAVPGAPPAPGLAARTIKDISHPREPEPVTAAGLTCIDAAEVDVTAWGDGRPFHDQIAPIRTALSSDRDRILPEEALRLARLYIHFGFGKEALEALDLAAGRSHSHDVLRAMAHLVDGRPAPSPVFAGQIDCPTDVALWALLAVPEFESGAGITAPRILQSLRRLPSALRGHLGVEVAARFAAIGEDETAETALTIAEEGYTVDDTGLGLVTADVDARRGEIDAAVETLGDLAAADPRMPPDRLVQLIDLMIEEGREVPPDLLTLAAAQRFEARGEPVADALLSAEIRALIAAGRYEDGLALLAAEGEDMPAEIRAEQTSAAILAMVAGAEDGRFLAFAFSGALPSDLSDSAENALARRLLVLGFAEAARTHLAGAARHEAARERRYLRAEIALFLSDPEAALRALRGMTDDRALGLLAQAHRLAGNHDAALGAAGARPDRTIAPEIAWRAGAWTRLRDSSDPLLREAAERRDLPEAPAPETLTERREMLDRAEETRTLVTDLLTRFPVDGVAGTEGETETN